MKFDKKAIVDLVGDLTIAQALALISLVGEFENDPGFDDLRHIAYVLATIKFETRDKILYETSPALFGYLPLQNEDVRRRLANELKIDLVTKPDLAIDPRIAYRIITVGMRGGLFAPGHTLARYIHDDVADYLHARRIVSRDASAREIADYAESFEATLSLTLVEPEKDEKLKSLSDDPRATIRDGSVALDLDEKKTREKPLTAPARPVLSESSDPNYPFKPGGAVLGGSRNAIEGESEDDKTRRPGSVDDQSYRVGAISCLVLLSGALVSILVGILSHRETMISFAVLLLVLAMLIFVGVFWKFIR